MISDENDVGDDQDDEALIAAGDQRLDHLISAFDNQLSKYNADIDIIQAKLAILENPPWIQELTGAIQLLSKELKQAQDEQHVCSRCKQACHPDDGNTSQSVTKKAKTVEEWKSDVECAVITFAFELEQGVSNIPSSSVRDMLLNNADLAISSQVIVGCDLILMFLNNIIKNPTNPRYRRISTTNTSYKTSLNGLAGHDKVLLSIGFVLKGSSYDYACGENGDVPPKEIAGELLDYCVQLLTAVKLGKEHLIRLVLKEEDDDETKLESDTKGEKEVDINADEADTADSSPTALHIPEDPVPIAAVPQPPSQPLVPPYRAAKRSMFEVSAAVTQNLKFDDVSCSCIHTRTIIVG